MSLFGTNITMTNAEYVALRDFIYKYSGIYMDEDKKFLLERRLAERLDVSGARNFSEYLRLLRFSSRGPKEIEEMFAELRDFATWLRGVATSAPKAAERVPTTATCSRTRLMTVRLWPVLMRLVGLQLCWWRW